MSIPAGWYPEPHTSDSRQRYWDGAVWTEHTAAVAGGAPPAQKRQRRSASKTLVLIGLGLWGFFLVPIMVMQYSGSDELLRFSNMLWTTVVALGLVVVIAGGVVKVIEISKRT